MTEEHKNFGTLVFEMRSLQKVGPRRTDRNKGLESATKDSERVVDNMLTVMRAVLAQSPSPTPEQAGMFERPEWPKVPQRIYGPIAPGCVVYKVLPSVGDPDGGRVGEEHHVFLVSDTLHGDPPERLVWIRPSTSDGTVSDDVQWFPESDFRRNFIRAHEDKAIKSKAVWDAALEAAAKMDSQPIQLPEMSQEGKERLEIVKGLSTDQLRTAAKWFDWRKTHAGTEQTAVAIGYTNHRGVMKDRKIAPLFIRFGESEWHSPAQWLMDAYDLEKDEIRSFAMKDIDGWEPLMTDDDLDAEDELSHGVIGPELDPEMMSGKRLPKLPERDREREIAIAVNKAIAHEKRRLNAVLDAYIVEYTNNPDGHRFRCRPPNGIREWAESREQARDMILQAAGLDLPRGCA